MSAGVCFAASVEESSGKERFVGVNLSGRRDSIFVDCRPSFLKCRPLSGVMSGILPVGSAVPVK